MLQLEAERSTELCCGIGTVAWDGDTIMGWGWWYGMGTPSRDGAAAAVMWVLLGSCGGELRLQPVCLCSSAVCFLLIASAWGEFRSLRNI